MNIRKGLLLGFLLLIAGSILVVYIRKNNSSYQSFGPEWFKGSPSSIKLEGENSAFTKGLNLKSSLLTDAVPTNRWWISALTEQWPETLFTLPFTSRLSDKGLSTGVPQIIVNADSIISPFQPDIQVTFPERVLDRSQIVAYDDQSVTISSLDTKGNTVFDTHFVKGSPLQALTLYESATIILPTDQVEKKELPDGRFTLSFSIHDQAYVVYSPVNIDLSAITKSATVSITKPTRITIAALPNNVSTNTQIAYDQASAGVIESITASFNDSKFPTANFQITTKDAKPTLFLLLPHQLTEKNLQLQSLGSFTTIRGEAKLVEGNNFTVEYPVPVPESEIQFPHEDEFFNRIALEQYLQQGIAEALKPGNTSYFGAKELYRLANLLNIAKQADSPTAPQFQEVLHSELTNWFTYSPGEKDKYFYYDTKIKGLVAVVPEFDSERFNDHHFHYGYFLYSAAILGRYDPTFTKEYSPVINTLVLDIANSERQEKGFPYLRVVDMYEGHSWAAGLARFSDGNNQESVSEAINAWYAINIWGKTSKNSALERLGYELYAQEVTAARTYYFNENPANPFPAAYGHNAVSLLWSGKATFETFFSTQPEAKHGILYLPLSPASLYLGDGNLIPNELSSLKKELGGAEPSVWKDTLLMVEGIKDPLAAQKKFTGTGEMDSSTSRAFMYVWLAQMGQR